MLTVNAPPTVGIVGALYSIAAKIGSVPADGRIARPFFNSLIGASQHLVLTTAFSVKVVHCLCVNVGWQRFDTIRVVPVMFSISISSQ